MHNCSPLMGLYSLQSDHIWYCELCKDGGDLLLCDTCPKSFHKECLKLEIVPDGEWSCPICVSLQYLTFFCLKCLYGVATGHGG